MHMSNGDDSEFQSEINVTPLVDVVLVLLIIFMVLVPLTLRGYEVDVPESSTAAPSVETRVQQVVLAIDADACPVVERPESAGLPSGCNVRLNDERLAVTDLAERVGEIFEPRQADDRVLFLSAEDRLNYEAVMRIIDVAKSGADGVRIGLVTEG